MGKDEIIGGVRGSDVNGRLASRGARVVHQPYLHDIKIPDRVFLFGNILVHTRGLDRKTGKKTQRE